MKMLVKLPSRSRPTLFRQRLAEYLADDSVSVLVTADLDDTSMNTPDMREYLASMDRVKVRWGNCKSKIEAVNDGLFEEPWSGLCIVGSDDMRPMRPDYAQRIAQLYDEFFPAGDAVLHLNDGRVGRALNTLPIFDRAYFDRFDYCYSPAYASVFADNEFQEISEHLGRVVYVNEVIVAHEWVGQHHPDALHQRNESKYTADMSTFRARKAAGFPR